jgi:hypothetical protein
MQRLRHFLSEGAVAGTRSWARVTLERLLGACEHDVEVLARPRVRRGSASLAELATTIEEDLTHGRERGHRPLALIGPGLAWR